MGGAFLLFVGLVILFVGEAFLLTVDMVIVNVGGAFPLFVGGAFLLTVDMVIVLVGGAFLLTVDMVIVLVGGAFLLTVGGTSHLMPRKDLHRHFSPVLYLHAQEIQESQQSPLPQPSSPPLPTSEVMLLRSSCLDRSTSPENRFNCSFSTSCQCCISLHSRCTQERSGAWTAPDKSLHTQCKETCCRRIVYRHINLL